MDVTKYTVSIRLLTDMLGTTPKSQDIYKDFIASKAVDAGLAEEEIATVESLEAKGWTGFMRDDEGHFMYSYAIKGFLCESARTLKVWGNLKQLQDKFKRYVHVGPRKIRLPDPYMVLERPLRAMTALGPRVALVRSDAIVAGTVIDFDLDVLDVAGITQKCIEDVLAYGKYIGLLQWRSGGYGSFEVLSVKEV